MTRVYTERSFAARAALREIRPQQWVKNFLVFVPILTSGDFEQTGVWLGAAAAFVAFCAGASAIYIVNDLLDLEADRRHPSKCGRPLASGALPVPAAIAMVPVLLGLGLVFSAIAGVLPYLILYVAASLAYSLKLKTMPLIDVFLLAGLYSVRLFAGGIATTHEVSFWLLAFSCFLFLGLAMMKRMAELSALTQRAETMAIRRSYRTSDLMIVAVFGVNATFISSLILALYVQSDAAMAGIGDPHLLWWMVPLMLFWQCRLWLATWRGHMTEDPIVFAARDWVSVVVGVCLLGTVVFAHLIP